MKLWPCLANVILCITLCVSIIYWSRQFSTSSTPPVLPARIETATLHSAVNLFGGRIAPSINKNIQLKGVLVANDEKESVAILSVDGAPAQAIRMNARVAENITIKEVHAAHVILAEGLALKRVELPALARLEAFPRPASHFSTEAGTSLSERRRLQRVRSANKRDESFDAQIFANPLVVEEKSSDPVVANVSSLKAKQMKYAIQREAPDSLPIDLIE